MLRNLNDYFTRKRDKKRLIFIKSNKYCINDCKYIILFCVTGVGQRDLMGVIPPITFQND